MQSAGAAHIQRARGTAGYLEQYEKRRRLNMKATHFASSEKAFCDRSRIWPDPPMLWRVDECVRGGINALVFRLLGGLPEQTIGLRLRLCFPPLSCLTCVGGETAGVPVGEGKVEEPYPLALFVG